VTQVVHKHLLVWDTAVTRLTLQGFARLIHVDRDTREQDKIALWFIVNDELRPSVVRTFHIVGTGHPVPPYPAKHVGSVLMAPYIWHVFEETD
jgi:hypothetical protein